MPYSPDWEKDLKEEYRVEFEERVHPKHLYEMADWWISKLQAREEWLRGKIEKAMPDLSEYDGKDLRFYQGVRSGIQHILSLLTPKN